MVSDEAFSSSTGGKRTISPRLHSSIAKRIFSDAGGDITVDVDGQSILLHKFPLISRSGRMRKMIASSRDPCVSRLELSNVPGGSEAFELAAKFCYGADIEINASNVATLRYIAEYLEMTEDYRQGNLLSKTESYLNQVVFLSLEKSIKVLCCCQELNPVAEEIGIEDKCVEAIALNASKEQLVSGLSHLSCNPSPDGVTQGSHESWIEDLSSLKIIFYEKIIIKMRESGVRSDTIVSSLIHYAQSYLSNIGKSNSSDSGLFTAEENRSIVETLINLLVSEETSSVPLTFLFGMLRMAIVVDASIQFKHELEKRIGFQLEMATLDDLLIPSLQSRDSLFDVDTVHRILVNFLQSIEEEDEEEEEDMFKSGHESVIKVGRLLDSYLAEIASDPYLSLQKFIAMAELLPEYARVVDDGLYRAVDLYLKAHPFLTEPERNKLCKLINCQKLSEDASDHAAENERLPVQTAIRILHVSQLRLRAALSSDSLLSSRRLFSGSAAASPRDNYASLRRENRELRLEISRIRVRLSELEKDQEATLKRGSAEHPRSGLSRKNFFFSSIFGVGRTATDGDRKNRRRRRGQKSDPVFERKNERKI